MARPKRIRRVTNPPQFRGFKPMGLSSNGHPVIMNYEEYESIRLNDFELLGQAEAAEIMGVSRPTYSRIYESARRKVAQAFVNGQPIIFEGGKVYFDSDWYKCNDCGCYFNHIEKEKELTVCALCSSSDISTLKKNREEEQIEDISLCMQCGKEKKHIHGTPCIDEICPDCNIPMIRKGNLTQNDKKQ